MLHRKIITNIKNWLNAQTPPVRRAVIFGAVVCLWMLTGIFSFDSTPQKEEPGLFKVVIQPSKAREIERTLTLRGEVQPDRTANIKAETAGRVSEVHLPKGSAVKRGDILFTLAPDSRPQKLVEAKANLKHFEKEYATAKGLEQKGFQAENRVAEAVANLESARAIVADIELDLEHTKITAPFDGIFEDRYVDVGDSIALGTDLAKVIDIDPLVLKGYVPQNMVNEVDLVRPVKAKTLSGRSLRGQIRYLSGQADELTRTYAVEVAVENPTNLRLAGSSVTMKISLGFEPAHFISSAFLSLAADGTMGVKVIDENNQVVFYPANIIQAEGDGVWLSGIPDDANIITVGHGFVEPGQKVDPQYPEGHLEPQKEASAPAEVSVE